MLRRYADTVPHVMIGLRGGRLGHEQAAFRLLEEQGVERLVLLVFVPTPGTRYADREPPSPEAAAELIAEARVRFPTAELTLGCMRPRGIYRDRLDELAVRTGVNGIVSPSRRAQQTAQELGLVPRTRRECCVFASPA